MHRNPVNVSTKRVRITALAKQSPEMAFTSLAYLMDIDWLKAGVMEDGNVSYPDSGSPQGGGRGGETDLCRFDAPELQQRGTETPRINLIRAPRKSSLAAQSN